MPDAEKPASEEDPYTKKRSGEVTLTLMAGCCAVIYLFGKLDPSQRWEEVRVYRDLKTCLDGHLRSPDDCRSSYRTALDLYPRAVPRYGALAGCEWAHGRGACLIGERVVLDAEKQYIPTMAAYVVGLTAEQKVPPQPVFGSACARGGSEGHDGYPHIAGSGALLATRQIEGSAIAYANSLDLRADPETLRKAVFGGFGQTGRTCIDHASGGSYHASGRS